VREQLSEVKRPWYSDPEELAGAVVAYLGGEVVEGWESRDDMIARLASLRADLKTQMLVVVSHGLLLTTWLHDETGLEDPFGFWSNLGLPDAWELNLEERSVERIG
jgi:broad specificity phosphatase PhoE